MIKHNYGYMGKILWIDLDTHKITSKEIDEAVYREYLTGYGLGVKIIYENQPPKLPPLDSRNILGFMSGLLTGTKAFFTGRYCVVGKSPLTGTWGDANSGGHFAPAIKEAGFDGIFFVGKSETPVYLLINGGQITLESTVQQDGYNLWGQTTLDTEQYLLNKHGDKFKVSCIGPSGEQQALISGIVTEGGRLAARSGLGALMGSKNLKALCISGTTDIEVFDQETIIKGNKKFAKAFKHYKTPILDYAESVAPTTKIGSEVLDFLTKLKMKPTAEAERYVMTHWGTAGVVSYSAANNDSPIKNWLGDGAKDFPASKSGKISNNAVTNLQDEKFGCYCCPMRCGGYMKNKDDSKIHKPEYETLCGFGTLLEADDLENIIEINHLFNCSGMDTISAATTVSWVYELVHEALIDKEKFCDENIKWSSNDGALALAKLMISGEGIGKYLRNGITSAAKALVEKGYIHEINRERALECGMVIQGQELPMHDPRKVNTVGVGLGVGYEAEPTPGRHTSTLSGADYYKEQMNKKTTHLHPLLNQNSLPEREMIGESLKTDSCFMDLINGLGMCAFGFGSDVNLPLIDYINAATGWHYDFDYYMTCAQRIKTLRHAFNIREGIDVKNIRMPERIRAGIEDYEGLSFQEVKNSYFDAMAYDPDTLRPTQAILKELNLGYVIKDLYGSDD
ncbi:aldehyde ferredoxin oxidoreductase family protein [Fusibacter sp. 3D3]|uniref:aldehyde ferredoxin oxidoreductase family protein n=1 Tax=Fusibacter sp. 3D3 TaxID=1048380 RepID=UPI000852AFD5|nr:aldehyde ferredoxin oxidoreductase C-terminal domain-containing protein [Fusibacter sp. 3D3]GAU79689.1 tungsten-containing aldehyde-ferredoxin oxidoreductase [Fusibacter sp. 3D3]